VTPATTLSGLAAGSTCHTCRPCTAACLTGVDPDAGRLRTVGPPAAPAGPGDPPDGEVVMAVPARHIRTASGKVLDVLDRAGLRGLATGTLAAVLAELYVDLRVLRPFQLGCHLRR